MTVKEVVESFISTIKLDMEQYHRLSAYTRARQVWFIAIAGFAILNAGKLWESILQRPLLALDYLLMTLPWLIVSVACVRVHYLSDPCDIANHKFFLNKLAEFDLFLEATKHGQVDAQKWKQLINDETESIKPLKKQAEKKTRQLNNTELFGFSMIVVGFAWTILVPLLMKLCQ